MKRKIALTLTGILLLAVSSFGQITKGFWMFGGNGNLRSGTFRPTGREIKSTQIDIQPRVGFFLADKLATGVLLNYNLSKNNEVGVQSSTSTSTYGIGPFIRYYFMPKEKQVNLLSELNLIYSRQTGVFNTNTGLIQSDILAGPAIFLNTSVAVELLMGYRYSKETISNGTSANQFLFMIGLQVYLEKDK
ncbi:MAG: hypothetical protein K2X48_19495 [Chitinophagaceae bacterium]|nr:hypothetical protein [Chitinophagaceae bacterium]